MIWKAEELHKAIKWNPYNKVVQDHRDGTVHQGLTDHERSKRDLRVPWYPGLASEEVHWPPIY
jgi:hypothetical protein